MRRADIQCPVCLFSGYSDFLCEVRGFDIYNCAKCAADHVYPMPAEEVLKRYYDSSSYYQGEDFGAYEDYDLQTAPTVSLVDSLLDAYSVRGKQSILDIGCGYGSHLACAADRGWECHGIEVSDHGRSVAHQRLGEEARVVESVDRLPRMAFDLITLFDVIEHLPSPYSLICELFVRGAITPETTLVMTTPNAGSDDARKNPGKWKYRYPPYHVIYYSAETFEFLFKRMQFSSIEIVGQYSLYPWMKEPLPMSRYDGLLVRAGGSTLGEFFAKRVNEGASIEQATRCWQQSTAFQNVEASPRPPLRLPWLGSRLVFRLYGYLKKIKFLRLAKRWVVRQVGK